MIETIANLQPILLVVILIVMYSVESFIPYLAKPANKKQHDIQNIILNVISFVVNGLLSLAVLATVNFTAVHQLGLFNQMELPVPAEIIGSVLLIDFGSYCFHILLHKIPFFWRFHRVHHSDTNLNATSSLRFHPVDVLFTQGIYTCSAIVIFGVSMTSFVIYGTIALIFVLMQHTNIRFPSWFEKYGRYVFSTPGWHKIHHSDEKRFTDSHYGDVFTFWDRIFGTWEPVEPHEINYGLNDFATSEKQKAGYLLRSPFIDISKS